MALYFVSTSVLSSEDGIGFEKEVKKTTESDADKAAKIAIENAKPLYEQLAEQNSKKQAEYDAMTKLIFGKKEPIAHFL